jgi:hypothetical protein
MAGPGSETQFGNLMAYYQLHPSTVPWEGWSPKEAVNYMNTIGLAAREAGKDITSGMLNPAVREQQRAEAARARLEQDFLQYSKEHQLYKWYGSAGHGGYAEVPGYTYPVGMPPEDQPKTKSVTDQEKPPPAPGDQQTDEGKKTVQAVGGPGSDSDYQTTAISSSTAAQRDETGPPPQAKPIPQSSSYGPPAAPISIDDLNSRIARVEDLLGANQYQYAAAGGPVVQRFQEGGQVQAPQAPVTPQQQPVQVPPVSPEEQQALAMWQASPQSGLMPPIPANKVKEHLKENWDSGVDRVAFNPGNGPGGQPTYTAYLKGGGSTTIPLSQIARTAPHLITSNNMSLAMSAADQQNQPNTQGPVWSPFGNQIPFPASAPAPPVPAVASNDPNAQIRAMVAQQISNPANLMASNEPGIATSNKVGANPSGLPDSQRSTRSIDSPPPPDVNLVGTVDEINQQSASREAQGWDKQPNGPGDLKVAAQKQDGAGGSITWFRDMRPGNSHVPFLINNETPWSWDVTYSDGRGTSHELLKPDGVLRQNVNTYLHQDPTNMTRNQMVDALQNRLWLDTHGPVAQSTLEKLEAIKNQVLQSQRAMDAVQDPGLGTNPANWSWVNLWKNEVRANAYQFSGLPFGEQAGRAMANVIAGGDKPNAAQTRLLDAWNIMHDEGRMSGLTGDERSMLDGVHMDSRLPNSLSDYNHNMAALLNRYIGAALMNNERLKPEWKDIATSIRNTGRVPDTGLSIEAIDGAKRTPYATVTPNVSPTATPRLSATPAKDFDIDVRGMTHDQMMKAIEGQSGKKVIDGTGQIRVLK